MIIKPNLEAAYKLFHEGILALAEVERAGVRVDVGYLKQVMEDVQKKIERNEKKLKSSKVFRKWKEVYGHKANLGSRVQLGRVLFSELDYECPEYTSKANRPKTDDKVLRQLDNPFVRVYLATEKLKKIKSTYLAGTLREVEGEFVHPFYNLHFVKTYRSSCDTPNAMNVPVRDPIMAEIVRRMYIPRPDHVFIEFDFSGHEWKTAACQWRDPKIIEDASDPKLDIHRDMAAKCYKLKKKQVSKDSRYCGKNGFTFPKLYGSDYIKISRNMWGMIQEKRLEVDGFPMMEHLENKGISRLGLLNRDSQPKPGTFEAHIYKVQQWWDNQFSELKEAQTKWIRDYEKRGWFPLLTGFVCKGVYSRNQLFNTPVQGPAFHILLWCLIRMVKELRKRKMRSKVVGEIHDSMLMDVHKDEIDDMLALAKRIMLEDVRKAWKWIIIPLEIGAEIAYENWFEKEPIKISA